MSIGMMHTTGDRRYMYIGGDLPLLKKEEFIGLLPVDIISDFSVGINKIGFEAWVEMSRIDADSGYFSPSYGTPIRFPFYTVVKQKYTSFCMGCGLSYIIPSMRVWWVPGYDIEQKSEESVSVEDFFRIRAISERCSKKEAVPLCMNSKDLWEVELVRHIMKEGESDLYRNYMWLMGWYFNLPPRLPAFRLV